MAYIFFACLFGGLLMYVFGKKYPKVETIGRMLFFAAVLGLLIALAPSAIHLLQHGG
jgi:hypothetical protein